MEEKLINSVKKAFDVLDILAFEDYKGHGKSLKELSARLDIKPNTLHGILKTMIFCGYAEKNIHARYKTGRRCRQIGLMNRFQFEPKVANTLSGAAMRLCKATGEGVSFYVLDNGERINYINYQSSELIKVDYTMLQENSVYDYPSGKILAAFCSDEERMQILSKHGYPQEHWNGAANAAEFSAELEKVRCAPYIRQETEGGTVTSFAAAVMANGTLLGSIGVYMPTFRATDEKEKLICDEMVKAVREIEKILNKETEK